jgi:hypothetical protein
MLMFFADHGGGSRPGIQLGRGAETQGEGRRGEEQGEREDGGEGIRKLSRGVGRIRYLMLIHDDTREIAVMFVRKADDLFEIQHPPFN